MAPFVCRGLTDESLEWLYRIKNTLDDWLEEMAEPFAKEAAEAAAKAAAKKHAKEMGAKAAKDVLNGSLRRKFPSEYLGKSLGEIKDALKTVTGKTKDKLQTARKILQDSISDSSDRLLKKVRGK